eukprot:4395018-Pyramimonas_sp.AAC.1
MSDGVGAPLGTCLRFPWSSSRSILESPRVHSWGHLGGHRSKKGVASTSAPLRSSWALLGPSWSHP